MGAVGNDLNRLQTVDDLIRKLASEETDDSLPLISFPSTGRSNTSNEYELLRGKDINRLAETAAAAYIQRHLSPVVSNARVSVFRAE